MTQLRFKPDPDTQVGLWALALALISWLTDLLDHVPN